MSAAVSEEKPVRRRLLLLLPLMLFLALAALFLFRLGSGDPSRIPSALIGRPAPATDLPPVPGLARGGEPLPGVYAAGEVAGFGGGGVHGYRALEGTFLGGCIFSGRIAGREAAKAVG